MYKLISCSFFADVLEEYFKLKYLPDALVIFKR